MDEIPAPISVVLQKPTWRRDVANWLPWTGYLVPMRTNRFIKRPHMMQNVRRRAEQCVLDITDTTGGNTHVPKSWIHREEVSHSNETNLFHCTQRHECCNADDSHGNSISQETMVDLTVM
ncbi:hypothetical protein E2C01_068050 [Portunus trituberculatus]|uniref:Uncharacterized protein n=1 Tax=Portunus trituberculatus TaxID=210409 RepID=A0A5B7HUR7_PORTR|nr:hypothetical protein [Portunus trituberculatus]